MASCLKKINKVVTTRPKSIVETVQFFVGVKRGCTLPRPSEISEKNWSTYSSVPNRRTVRNKRAGGKILEKH